MDSTRPRANTNREGESCRGGLKARCHTTDDLTVRYIYTRLAANVTKAYRYYYYRMVNVLAGQVVKDGACVWATAWPEGVVGVVGAVGEVGEV